MKFINYSFFIFFSVGPSPFRFRRAARALQLERSSAPACRPPKLSGSFHPPEPPLTSSDGRLLPPDAIMAHFIVLFKVVRTHQSFTRVGEVAARPQTACAASVTGHHPEKLIPPGCIRDLLISLISGISSCASPALLSLANHIPNNVNLSIWMSETPPRRTSHFPDLLQFSMAPYLSTVIREFWLGQTAMYEIIRIPVGFLKTETRCFGNPAAPVPTSY